MAIKVNGITKDVSSIPDGVLSSRDITEDIESWFVGFNSINLNDTLSMNINNIQTADVNPPELCAGVLYSYTGNSTTPNCVFYKKCSEFTLNASVSINDKPTTDGAIGLIVEGYDKPINITSYCVKHDGENWIFHFDKLQLPYYFAGKAYRLVVPVKYGGETEPEYHKTSEGIIQNVRTSTFELALNNVYFGQNPVDPRILVLSGVPSGADIYINFVNLLTVLTEKNLTDPPFKKTVDGTAVYISNYTYNNKDCIVSTRMIDGKRKVAHISDPVYWEFSKNTDDVVEHELRGSETRYLSNIAWGTRNVNVDTYLDGVVTSSDYIQYQYRVDEEYTISNPRPLGTQNTYATTYNLGDDVVKEFVNNLTEKWSADIFLNNNNTVKVYATRYTGTVHYYSVKFGTTTKLASEPYTAGKAYTIRALPSDAGVTFSGWYVSPTIGSGTYTPGAIYAISANRNGEDKDLYAIANPTYYQVNIDWKGGTSDTNSAQIAYYSRNFTPPSAKNGAMFIKEYCLSGTSTVFASSDGTLMPNISGYTDDSGQYIATGDVSVYAVWANEDMTVIFDPNGGEFKSDPPRRTVNGRVSPLPSVSRRGYIFKGWRPRKLIDEAGTPQYFAEKISTDTVFSSSWCVWTSEDGVSKYVNMQATWAALDVDENYPNSYLEVSYKDDDGNIIDHIVKLPQVVSIDDVITSSLVEKETILYGYKNRFVMDIGTKRTFAVTMVRVNPVDYDDNVTPDYDESKMSNNMWWSQFISLIDRWQNYMVSSDGVRTGGMRFVYEPPSVDGLNDLYPVIDKNVFITGQITMSSTPSLLKMTIPMTVASMSASESVQRWKVRFYMYKVDAGGDQESVPYFETSAPMGFMMTIPAPMSEWSNAYSASTTPKSFSKWVDSAGNTLRPNEELPMPQDYTDSTCPIYYATWADISAICIYTVTGELNANRKYTYTADRNCIISAILYGGGGTGGSFYMESINFGTNFRYYAGGGGGASAPTSVSFTVSQGETVTIDVGLGGNSYPNCDINDSGGVLLSGVRNGTPTKLTHGYAEYESKYGAAGTNKQKGGSFNGGDGGEPHSDGNKGRGANESSGGMQRTIAEGWGITTEYHGGGGGGGSITLVRANEKVTYNDKEYRPSYVYKGANVYLNGDSIGANGTVYILSKGGDGQTHGVDNSDNTTCDAMNGTDVSGSERFIFCSAGGGGRAGAILKRSKGADGVAILYITTVGDSL